MPPSILNPLTVNDSPDGIHRAFSCLVALAWVRESLISLNCVEDAGYSIGDDLRAAVARFARPKNSELESFVLCDSDAFAVVRADLCRVVGCEDAGGGGGGVCRRGYGDDFGGLGAGWVDDAEGGGGNDSLKEVGAWRGSPKSISYCSSVSCTTPSTCAALLLTREES